MVEEQALLSASTFICCKYECININIYIITLHITLTPWSRNLRDNLIVAQLFGKFIAIPMGPRGFFTVFLAIRQYFIDSAEFHSHFVQTF
jgi:hypothetical protein